ncbi:MAG: hypothetical protein KJ630_24210 [Proteobacteria bacterium]|nr:hypothetical protein [Pseudomonadota bacterium]
MIGSLKLAVLFLFGFFTLAGCSKEYVPVEPAPNTGTVFQRTPEDVQAAARNALTKLSFAITKETAEYIEAVHLKPGETVDDNESEMLYIWIKPRENNVLVLTYTRMRATGIAKQKYWDQQVVSKMIEELQ